MTEKTTAFAKGTDLIQQNAATDAKEVQNACNLVAVVGCFHRHLLALRGIGVCGDALNNHPISLAFTSKLNSLCRMSLDRELAAFEAIDKLATGGIVEFEVISIRQTG